MNLAWKYWVLSMWEGIYRYSVVSSVCECVCTPCTCTHEEAVKTQCFTNGWVFQQLQKLCPRASFKRWPRDLRHFAFAAMPMEYLDFTQQWQDRKKPEVVYSLLNVRCLYYMTPLGQYPCKICFNIPTFQKRKGKGKLNASPNVAKTISCKKTRVSISSSGFGL